MTDYIVRATAADGLIRAYAAVTTKMVGDAASIHNLSPVASAALGRTMTAAAMMSKMKLASEDNAMTIQIRGDGPLGGIVVASDYEANVRGYVYNPEVDPFLNEEGKLDVGRAVGKHGYMNVIMDLGLKEPYIGFVELMSGEIGDDIAYYFAKSEQTPSVVALGVLVDKDGSIINAGGYIIQLMPGAGEDIIDYLESKIASTAPVTALLSDNKSPEDILEMILGEKDLKIADKSGCGFVCNCSRERMERNLISLGREELMDIIEEQHGAELQCHFCNKKYLFSEQELRNLLEQ